MVNGTLGTAEGFGAVILKPIGNYAPGQVLPVSVQVDAKPTAASNPLTMDLFNNAGTMVATGIKLYNDGTHGDLTANDAIWTNDGSDTANPTYTVPLGTTSSTGWLARAFARDASTSTQGSANNGLVHRNGLPSTAVMANYWNIDEGNFAIVAGTISVTKVSNVISDPVNGTTNPKAIPGALVEYCILITNTGATTVSTVNATDPLPATFTYAAGTMFSGTTCAGAATAEDDDTTGTDETDPYGASITGTTLTATAGTLATGSSFALRFRGTIN